MSSLPYLQGYRPELISQVNELIETNRLRTVLERRYPDSHAIRSDKALYDYTMALKNRYLKKSSPLSKVIFDDKITLKKQALGLHSYVAKNHGGKIKSKNEIRIAARLKEVPEPLLRMVVVHELAHLKEKDHNKAFYQLCCHMQGDYHQLEFDLRLWLTMLDLEAQEA
ncbi:YgjP-like metallopeptidase domain-containing protein [Shewanella sp. cp20]|uniref:YgjP-like metallopeptidase domain-containing protein n=1 Tax=Shewanella sp. cp20 TaxID=1521167 RepID=UPI00059F6FE6|nr:YgjP-like metallopeptidase domain-containing protein [Shewanella sp. cp20]KIO37436.1 metal-dependent hydrolase [Shewanella sp. cp20]